VYLFVNRVKQVNDLSCSSNAIKVLLAHVKAIISTIVQTFRTPPLLSKGRVPECCKHDHEAENEEPVPSSALCDGFRCDNINRALRQAGTGKNPAAIIVKQSFVGLQTFSPLS
jgi:hypothetical protein